MNEQAINWVNHLDEMRLDCARGQKKGLHFMAASIIVWAAIFLVHVSDMPMLDKNIYTFWCTGITFPLALIFSKIFRIDFAGKSNPLNKAGLLFTCNQIIYLIIPIWMCGAGYENMLMVFTIIFGAHLLPYSWLYKSPTYFALSIFIPIAAVIVGCNFDNTVLAAMMICVQIMCAVGLTIENVILKKVKIDKIKE